MANEIGSIKPVNGTSMGLNGQTGMGGHQPSAAGNANPGNTKPPKPAETPVLMPK